MIYDDIMNMTETLRQAMHASGLSIRRLSLLSGVPYAAVFRFHKAEGDIQLATADKLARVVGLELRPVKGRRRRLAKVAQPGQRGGGS